MKITIACSFIFLSLGAIAQKKVEPLDYPHPFAFTLVDSSQLSKVDIYTKCLEWLAKSYGDSKAVLQLQDKELGKIIGKGLLTLPISKVMAKYRVDNDDVSYIITVDVKPNKYRVVIDNFFQKGGKSIDTYGVTYTEGFGYLDSAFVPVKDRLSGTVKRSREYRYNEIKNYCMQYSLKLLQELKTFVASSKPADF